MITVGMMREALAGYPDNAIVVQSKDAEGNGFSPFYQAELAWYRPETTWSGEVVSMEAGIEPGDRQIPAVVLWPVK